MKTEQKTVTPDLVNAWEGDDGLVTVAFRPGPGEFWQWFELTTEQATQLADQLRLLTHTTD